MYNAEPVADFIDLALIGEGEELLPELVDLYRRAKGENWDKPRFLRAAAEIQGYMFPLFITFRITKTVPSPPSPLWTARRRRWSSGWSTIWTSPITR